MQTTDTVLSDDSSLVISPTIAAIDGALSAFEVDRTSRGHLGMSEIGNPDARTLWLKFRWSLPDNHSPRTLRIFRLGNLIELELASLLRMVPGVTLHTENPKTGEQFNFKYLGGHFSGSMDGCMIGLPDAPKSWHVWEAKSVGKKFFNDLVKKGVKEWNKKYYAQLQCYMGATKIERALFMAYNKDNSEIHLERVHKEPMFWEGMLANAERIITRYEMPESSWKDRTWYESKFMSEEAQSVYWGDRLPKPNCRNCRFSEAVVDDSSDAMWHCNAYEQDLTIDEQMSGCTAGHAFIPCFMSGFADPVSGNESVSVYRVRDSGNLFANGNAENFDNGHDCVCYSSHELYSMVSPCTALSDDFISSVKVMFSGSVYAK